MGAYTWGETYGVLSMFLRPALPSSGRPIHSWTRWYWPTALVLALALFFVPWLAGFGLVATGLGLAAGALVLGVPELAALCTANYQDTLSDWFWRAVGVIGPSPVDRWNAKRFLILGGYLLVAGNVLTYLFELTQVAWQFWLLFGSGCFFFGVWLLGHFFERWWV